MSSKLPLCAALSIGLLISLATPVPGQSPSEWRLGLSYLISRPNDARVWGVGAQREQRLTRVVVFRSVASVDLLGPDLVDPMLVTVGADIGLRARLAPLSALIAVGPTLGYFAAERRLYPTCQGGSCFTIQQGYEPGLLAAGTGSLALELRVSSELRVFTEVRVHVPSGIGRSGFALDPHAAFVERLFGVVLMR